MAYAKTDPSDFSKGRLTPLILHQAIPVMLAQIAQMLYNIVDRIYIGHMPGTGEAALSGVGLVFPIITIIAAFTNLYGTGGAPLFAIARGHKDRARAERILGNTTTLLVGTAFILMAVCYIFEEPVLRLFGADAHTLPYASTYIRIYLIGTVFSMFATGMTPFINAEGFPKTGMATTVIGVIINFVLDPIFIFVFHMGISGAAVATVISQFVGAAWAFHFLTSRKALLKIEVPAMHLKKKIVEQIFALGLSGFIMNCTNALVQIVYNATLSAIGGSLFVGIMTVVNSVRQIAELPALGLTSGTSPVLGYNYGAKCFDRVKKSIRIMFALTFAFSLAIWIFISVCPHLLMAIFTSSARMIAVGQHALRLYFFGFVFMSFQYTGQTTFQSLGKSHQAIFFSLLRKVFIVVPLTVLLPKIFGVYGVFAAEPISNVIGGLASFLTMYVTVYRRLPSKNKAALND